jgi:DNA-binding NtrC family response regulator
LGRRVALSAEALAWLEGQPWPGNVRQLEHAIERAAVLSDKEVLEVEHLTSVPSLRAAEKELGGEGRGEATLHEAVEIAERHAIAAALQATGGNRRAAALRLGVSLRTLFYKLRRHGFE